MKNVSAGVVICGLLCSICLAGTATAQTSISPLGSCSGFADLRAFTIRDARLSDPFSILRWRRPSAATLTAIEGLRGAPYTFAAVDAVSRRLESETWLPDTSDGWLGIDYSDIGIDHCQEQQLDVVFTIFSATISPTLSTLFEWRSRERMPNEIAGLAETASTWQFAPDMGFDRAQRLAVGGRGRATWANGRLPFGSLEARGVGSTQSHSLSASLVGQYDSAIHWLRRATWRVAAEDASTPAGHGHLGERRLEGRFSGTSRVVDGVAIRFGGILGGGRIQSGSTTSPLPPKTLAATDFTSSTLYGGMTARGRQHAFAASYALVLGSTDRAFHGAWREYFSDVAHEFRIPFSDHRLFEFEQRLTSGRLHAIQSVPASERFFGGSGDRALLLGDNWRIPTSALVRSIPTNRFSLAESGVGGDRFVSYSSTTAFTAWGKPIVPRELLDDPEFRRKLQGQLVSARSALDIVYRSDDPNFRVLRSRLPDVMATLLHASRAEAALRSAGRLPGNEFAACEDALRSSSTAVNQASKDKASQAYGWVTELLPDGESALASVVSACGVDLVARLQAEGAATGELESASDNLRQLASMLETRFSAIDSRRSDERAATDLGYAERAIDVITKEMNLTSISPVLVFDVAHIGPSGNDPYGGTRYAVGGGVRLTLVSTASVTVTFAVSPHHQPWEGPGALSVSLTTRNLFE